MKIYSSIDEFAATGVEKTIVTTGTFDGVHQGHQHVLSHIKELAQKTASESVLLTFDPHPRLVLFGDNTDLQLLSTPEERKDLLEKAGIQHLIVHPFTKQLSRVTALNYTKDILVKKLHTHVLVLGHDHRFGKNREGSIKDLKEWGPEYGFRVEEMEPFKIDTVTVSSTKIRKALSVGDLQTANKFLGYNYFIHAKVVSGLQLGTELGYPTANLHVEDRYKLVPVDGIYAVYVTYNEQTYKGMMSIGMNPTIEGKGRSMEVHIFDFNENIYEKNLKVSFYRKIRDEEKFNNLADLKVRLDKDKEICLDILK